MDPKPLPSRVLIVDDEHIVADTLAMIFKQDGYDAAATYSGEAAVEMARVMKPDVLISDVVMAGMNGIEASLRISTILPRCRVILISGNTATGELLRDAEENGHNFEILAKPVHPRDLLARVTAPSDPT